MVAWTWIQEHRFLSVAVLVVLILSTAGGTCWAVFFRTVSSPVSLKDALRLYRRTQTEQVVRPLSITSRLPAPGVYTYRTTGLESLSLLGARRVFPSATSMIVTDDRCATVSWVPMSQHIEDTTTCPAANGAVTVPQMVSREQIAGTTTTATLTCPATTYLIPPVRSGSVPAGTRRSWSSLCHLDSPHEMVRVSGVDLGRSSVMVAGSAVSTEHVRLTLHYVGTESGTNPSDYWISTSDGLIVRQRESVEVTQQGVHYTEKMGARLTSLTPAD